MIRFVEKCRAVVACEHVNWILMHGSGHSISIDQHNFNLSNIKAKCWWRFVPITLLKFHAWLSHTFLYFIAHKYLFETFYKKIVWKSHRFVWISHKFVRKLHKCVWKYHKCVWKLCESVEFYTQICVKVSQKFLECKFYCWKHCFISFLNKYTVDTTKSMLFL